MKSFIICVLSFLVLCVQAQTKESAPLVNYGFTPVQDGKIMDWTKNAVLVPGAKAVVENGPLGAKAVKFDGTRGAVSKLDLSKIKDALDGFDFSIAFWVRFDAIHQASGDIMGNDTGLGLSLGGDRKFRFGYGTLGPNAFIWGSASTLEIGKWHHIAFAYSVDAQEARLYLDGVIHQSTTEADLAPLRLNLGEIGKFDGAIAGLQIWDRAIAEDEITRVAVDEKSLNELRGKLDKLTPKSPGLAKMIEDTTKEIVKCRNRKNITLSELNGVMKLIDTALKLGEAEKALRNTSVEKSPFAVMRVQAVSSIIRTPEEFPQDAEYTPEMRAAAAKGEFEPFSFIVHPYENIEKFEMKASDFKSEDGAAIPASALDMKVVKCWYQANWNSYFNSGNQILVPDLLLNDETLVKVDEVKRKNYLRIEYPDGTKYCDVNFGGTFESVKPFNYLIDPVRDAKTLQSVKLIPGRGTQFWGVVHVPQNAKSGLYTSKIALTADGKDAGHLTLKLRVFPFELPVAKTHYDLSQEYLTYVIGGAALDRYSKLTKNVDEAERILRMDVINQRDHNIRTQMASAYSAAPGGKEMFERDIKLRLSCGIPLKPFIGGGSGEDFGLYLDMGQVGFAAAVTPERLKSSFDEFKKRVDGVMTEAPKLLGHNDIYFYGIDEAQGAGAFRFMSAYRDYIFEKGGKIMTSGWHENYLLMPSHEMLHAQAAEISTEIAERWHAIKGKVVCYAGPFAGPDNPDLLRRSHGMRMYKANYDGFFMLSYFEGLHVWNERVNGKYRNFLIAYPTVNGPVNTLSIEGLREGLDDVRYATLLKQTAEKCFNSGNRRAIYAAKKAVAWFELVTPGDNLDLMRLEMADHIVTMMRELGMEVGK